METVDVVFDQMKAAVKSGQNFFDGLFHRRRHPIEILKRLQREAFCDLMKLRDRQEKIERLITFYKSSKEGPFQEGTTHVRGHVNFLGALLLMDSIDQQSLDAYSRSGIRTGVSSKFIFQTTIGQKDALAAEFVASQKGKEHCDDVLQMPLSLTKLSYMANVNDWLSLMAIPVGAKCGDVGIALNSFGQGLTDLTSYGPSLLNMCNGSGIGISVRKSNVIASLAQFVSGLGMPFGTNAFKTISSTFGQLVCEFPQGIKLSLLGLRHVPLSSKRSRKFGALTFPIVLSKELEVYEAVPEALALDPASSFAVMAEYELDGFTKIGGWVEIEEINPKSLQWAVTMSDVSEDTFGWGLSLCGRIEDSASYDHFQVESYLKINMEVGDCYGRAVDVGDLIRTRILGATETIKDNFGDDLKCCDIKSNVTQVVQVINGACFVN